MVRGIFPDAVFLPNLAKADEEEGSGQGEGQPDSPDSQTVVGWGRVAISTCNGLAGFGLVK